MTYLIVMCPYCGEIRAIKENQKTALCYKCGRRFRTLNARIVMRSVPSNKVVEIIKYLKTRKGRELLLQTWGREINA
ncbi:MAG: hypothetical protein DRO15_07470 [Thermoprotei archaeon]|nr:MAG: hypothetical protein DRO15_07470 [Thermoprotei archaeon]